MRPANLLKNSKILASGTNYILINVSSEVESKGINEYQNETGFEDFIQEILGIRKKIFCLDQIQAKRIVDNFKKRMKEGTLPEKIEIQLEDKTNQENETEEKHPIEKIFKKIEIRED